MSRGRKLGLSGLTSLSLDSLEAGVGSMTDSRPFGYYSYFFRMFRVLAFEAVVRCGRCGVPLFQRAVLCREDQHFCDFWRGVPPVETNTGESCDSGRRMGLSGVFVIV